jgi:hypothetical protein
MLLKKSVALFGLSVGVILSLAGCSNLPDYRAKALKDAIEGEGLTLQLQQEAKDRFKGLPILVNAPPLTFNLVTVDPDLAANFNFTESETGYLWNNYFTQKALVNQFIGNTTLAMNAMGIPLTATQQQYQLDITLKKAMFTAQLLKQVDLDKGYKQFMLGKMETAYRIINTKTRSVVFEQSYEVNSTRFLPSPAQREEVSAGLLYQMMSDSSVKFGKDIAEHCAFYTIPNISCH